MRIIAHKQRRQHNTKKKKDKQNTAAKSLLRKRKRRESGRKYGNGGSGRQRQKSLPARMPTAAGDAAGKIMLFGFALGRKVQKLGGEIWRFTKVTGLEQNADGSIGRVLTDKGDVTAKYVIDAAGVWSNTIGRMVGIEIPVTMMKGDLLVTESDVKICNRYVCEIGYNFLRNDQKLDDEDAVRQKYGVGFLMEPTGANNALIGFSKYPGSDTKTNFAATRAIAKRAIRFYPMIADVNIIRTYAGLRP